MANKYVTLDSFRKDIVNKRISPAYAVLDEALLNGRYKALSETQYCYILNECIYNEDTSDLRVYYILNGVEEEISEYTVNAESAVITFDNGYNPIDKNLYCHYKGGGSIIWVEDVLDLQKVTTNMDQNTVYIDGSNFMTGDLKMGEGTSEHPYKNIVNVNLVDGIDVSAHNHTGNTNGSLIPTAGIENSAITENKIANNAVTTTKILNSSVVNDKIRTETITADKFNSTMIGNGLKRSALDNIPNSVLQTNIDNKTITYNSGVMQIPFILNFTGIVVPFAGKVAPVGWLLCDGKNYNTAEYPNLFQVIGYTYGGSGSTFKVPDFVNKTFWGGNASNVGTNLDAGIPNHYHGFGYEVFDNGGRFLGTYKSGSGANPTIDVTTKSNGGSQGWNGSGNDAGHSKTSLNHTTYAANLLTSLVRQEANSSTGGGVYKNISTVQPPAIQMMFIIKT